jgi:hypothetical protein
VIPLDQSVHYPPLCFSNCDCGANWLEPLGDLRRLELESVDLVDMEFKKGMHVQMVADSTALPRGHVGRVIGVKQNGRIVVKFAGPLIIALLPT